MKTVYNYIVEPKDDRYDNTVKIGSIDFIVNSDISEHKHISRTAIVKAIPSGVKTEVKVGDEVIVHHNIFRRWYDIRGNEKNSSSYISEDKYICNPDQIFMYRRDGGEWVGLGDFCFVSPVKDESEGLRMTNDLYIPNLGIVEVPSRYMESQGLVKGSKIGFTMNSEYEFEIDGKLMYKMSSDDICLRYD